MTLLSLCISLGAQRPKSVRWCCVFAADLDQKINVTMDGLLRLALYGPVKQSFVWMEAWAMEWHLRCGNTGSWQTWHNEASNLSRTCAAATSLNVLWKILTKDLLQVLNLINGIWRLNYCRLSSLGDWIQDPLGRLLLPGVPNLCKKLTLILTWLIAK